MKNTPLSNHLSITKRDLVKTQICELCKSQKKSVNHSKSKIPFDKLGYFSLSVYEIGGLKWGSLFHQFFFLSTKCKARRKGGKDRLLQNSCQINGIKAVLKLHFIFSTRKVNCLGLKTFWLLLKVPCCIVNWHFWQRSKPITFDSSTPHSSGETSKYKDFGSMWTI